MRILLCLIVLSLLTGCSGSEDGINQAQVGSIGTDMPISREMAAKTIALAFYDKDELAELETEISFSDVSSENWSYNYIRGCVEKGFFTGSEEGEFRPDDDLTLWEAQLLIDRIAPDHDSRVVLTDENKEMAVSYELWMQLLETSLQARRGEDSLYSYGIRKKDAVLLSAEGVCDIGHFSAQGIDLQPYLYSRVTFWEKQGEILALLTVEAKEPTIQNVYCHRENGKMILKTGEGTVALSCRKNFDSGIYDVRLVHGRVEEMVPASSLGRCTVKRVNAGEILLAEKGTLKWAENARIYDGRNEMRISAYSDLICGTEMAEFYEKEGEICGAVIRKDVIPEQMRIFLKGAEQETITVSSQKGFTLKNGKTEKKFGAGQQAVLSADLPWFDHGILMITAGSPIRVDFSDGTSYQYEGILEMERRGENSFTVINELPLERYLLGVVPNEMPVSFGKEALKAQAIAARSFAYNQFYGNSYCDYGAHVVDTTSSQVYLGYSDAAEDAVKETEGMCAVTEDGAVAQTYFYSTSCGLGAGSEEVWSADGTFRGKGKTYLKAQSYGNFKVPQKEEEWLSFWQDWERDGHDTDSPWYRWKVYYSCGQLTEIFEKKLSEISESKRHVVQLQHDDGGWKEFQKQDMGVVRGLSVTRRGEKGIAMELQVTFEKGVVKVVTENAIRKVLSPSKITKGDPIYLQRYDGESVVGNVMLPSAFFAVKEMKNDKGVLTGVALYGGGNGHGVGMSQYGAKGLAAAGKTAEEIIEYYFSGTTVEKVL